MKNTTIAWLQRIDRTLQSVVLTVCAAMLLAMVAFLIYTVIMRYVFLDPPFWADTVAIFANIWFVMLAYSLSVRDREQIAMQALYAFLTPRQAMAVDALWGILALIFGGFLLWYGWEAAMRVPGQFWELGGFPKRYAVMIMPIAGALIIFAALVRVTLDIRAIIRNEVGNFGSVAPSVPEDGNSASGA
ncbi:MAG: TRAP transporter small permease [Hyphomicrobiales bacterium]